MSSRANEASLIVTLERDVLPSLGQARVPTDAILSLVCALRYASLLHSHGSSDGAELMSPHLARASSRSSNTNVATSSDKKRNEDDTSWDSTTTLVGTTLDDYELPRERFAYWCLDLLFLMCNQANDGKFFSKYICNLRRRRQPRQKTCILTRQTLCSAEDRKRLAVLALPELLGRSSSVLRLYIADSAVRGKIPFRRYTSAHSCSLRDVLSSDCGLFIYIYRVREEELIYILRRLGKLELDEGVFEAATTENSDRVEVLRQIEAGESKSACMALHCITRRD